MSLGEQCEHGSLRRQCRVCELEEQLAAVTAERDELAAENLKLCEQNKAMVDLEIPALRFERDKYRKALLWALGAEGNFPSRPEHGGLYWWRSTLREQLGWKWNGETYVEALAPSEPVNDLASRFAIVGAVLVDGSYPKPCKQIRVQVRHENGRCGYVHFSGEGIPEWEPAETRSERR